MATEVNLDKVLTKLDEKKMEELANFLDHVSTLNEVLTKVGQLKDSGALDVLINFSYGPSPSEMPLMTMPSRA